VERVLVGPLPLQPGPHRRHHSTRPRTRWVQAEPDGHAPACSAFPLVNGLHQLCDTQNVDLVARARL